MEEKNPKKSSKNFIIRFFSLSFFKVSSRRKFSFYIVLFLVAFLFVIRYIYSQQFNQVPGVKTTLDLLLFYFLASTILNFLKLVFVSSYRKKEKLSIDKRDNIITGIESLYWVILFIIIFVGTLQFIDVDLKTFFASFALVSVAFSWLFKEYIANIIDGILIMFSDDFKIGDYIKVGEYKGRIREITFINTEIRTDEGDIVFIPNTLIIQREVTNFSKVRFKRIIYEFEIDRTLFQKIRKIEKVILKNLKKEFSEILEEEKFFLRVIKIHHEGALLSAEIPVKKYNFTTEDAIEKNVSLSVMEFIDDNQED